MVINLIRSTLILQMGKRRPWERQGFPPLKSSSKSGAGKRKDPAGACPTLTAPICSAPASGPVCSACPTTTMNPRGQMSVSPTSRMSTAAKATTTASSPRRGSSHPGPSCMESPSPTPPGPRLPCLWTSHRGHRRVLSPPSHSTKGHLLANQGWPECLLANQGLVSSSQGLGVSLDQSGI